MRSAGQQLQLHRFMSSESSLSALDRECITCQKYPFKDRNSGPDSLLASRQKVVKMNATVGFILKRKESEIGLGTPDLTVHGALREWPTSSVALLVFPYSMPGLMPKDSEETIALNPAGNGHHAN